nr:MAG TPA: hypothetical protein [Caudoviricetes sp.]
MNKPTNKISSADFNFLKISRSHTIALHCLC